MLIASRAKQFTRRSLVIGILATTSCAVIASTAQAQATPEDSDKTWTSLQKDIFDEKPISEANGVVKVTAPKRAQDAGLVPVDIEIAPTAESGAITAVTLVIDENPSPLAAKFTIDPESGVHRISTRVRVNDYSYLRVIAETAKGQLLMHKTFVKASGGCSAPAVKSPEEARSTMGQIKLRQFGDASQSASSPHELQVMIRHPNNSGFQMDQITRNYIPPHFIRAVEISQGKRSVLKMEGGISISEDPNFRFDYLPLGKGDVEVKAEDTEGQKFQASFPLGGETP